MQRPNEKKRAAITAAAARLFATRPFHQVRLDDIAAAASVGKGTLYIYFKSKEALYFSLIHEAFAALVDRLRGQLEQDRGPAIQALGTVVEELVGFSVKHPHLFELMRSMEQVKCTATMAAKRQELFELIEKILRRGVRRGELRDPNPHITALCIPGMVRSVFLFGPRIVNSKAIVAQLVGLLERGLCRKEKA